MKIELAHELASLHYKFGIYDSIPKFDELRNHENCNILNFCKEFESLKFFNKFFDNYFKHYDSLPSRFTSEIRNSINTKQARGVDFPFIGENVITTGKAKFMFVFEGSLSNNSEDSKKDNAKLSITVLSNFWHLEDRDEIKALFKKQKDSKVNFWNESNFLKVKSQLHLNQDIVKNCFVTDAVRIAEEDDKTKIDIEKNRDLIWKEIGLIEPSLVICVGGKAKEIVGMQYSDLDTKFHHIPFPTYRKSAKKNIDDKVLYDKLPEIYDKVLKLNS